MRVVESIDRASAPAEPIGLHSHALKTLQYVRSTMDSAGFFTSVSGKGGIAVGLIGLTAAWLASHPALSGAWLSIWLVAGLCAFCVGTGFTLAKTRACGSQLSSGIGRRFVLCLCPSWLSGAILTAMLVDRGLLGLLPGVWLLSYGSGVLSGGSLSIRPVTLMGASCMMLGVLALITPGAFADLWLAAGFGAAHIVFGAVIARSYGG